jgi:hypothetical protein
VCWRVPVLPWIRRHIYKDVRAVGHMSSIGLHRHLSQNQFAAWLVESFGFPVQCNYVYMPKKGLDNATKTRYAFVNFCDASLARDIIMKFNGHEVTFAFGGVSLKCFLEVAKAKEQGLEANLAINSDKALCWSAFQIDSTKAIGPKLLF